MTATGNTKQEVRYCVQISIKRNVKLIASLHTCDKNRSVLGLTEIFADFFPWLCFTKGFSGACKSNRTLVSPTQNARYRLKHDL